MPIVFDFDCNPKHKKCCKCPVSGSSVFVHLTAFVDDEFGNDSTAVLEDMSKPFKTIQAALAAVLADSRTSTQGFTIYVHPGTYTVTASLVYPNLVDFYFESGAIVVAETNAAIFAPVAGGTTSVLGLGIFRGELGPIATISPALEVEETKTFAAGFSPTVATFKGQAFSSKSEARALFEVKALCNLTVGAEFVTAEAPTTAILDLTAGPVDVDFQAERVGSQGGIVFASDEASGTLSFTADVMTIDSVTPNIHGFEIHSNALAITSNVPSVVAATKGYLIYINTDLAQVADRLTMPVLDFDFVNTTIVDGGAVFTLSTASSDVLPTQLPRLNLNTRSIKVRTTGGTLVNSNVFNVADFNFGLTYESLDVGFSSGTCDVFKVTQGAQLTVTAQGQTSIDAGADGTGWLFNVDGVGGNSRMAGLLVFSGPAIDAQISLVQATNGAFVSANVQRATVQDLNSTNSVVSASASSVVLGNANAVFNFVTNVPSTKPTIAVSGGPTFGLTLGADTLLVDVQNGESPIVQVKGTATLRIRAGTVFFVAPVVGVTDYAISAEENSSLFLDIAQLNDISIQSGIQRALVSLQNTGTAALVGQIWQTFNLANVVYQDNANIASTINVENLTATGTGNVLNLRTGSMSGNIGSAISSQDTTNTIQILGAGNVSLTLDSIQATGNTDCAVFVQNSGIVDLTVQTFQCLGAAVSAIEAKSCNSVTIKGSLMSCPDTTLDDATYLMQVNTVTSFVANFDQFIGGQYVSFMRVSGGSGVDVTSTSIQITNATFLSTVSTGDHDFINTMVFTSDVYRQTVTNDFVPTNTAIWAISDNDSLVVNGVTMVIALAAQVLGIATGALCTWTLQSFTLNRSNDSSIALFGVQGSSTVRLSFGSTLLTTNVAGSCFAYVGNQSSGNDPSMLFFSGQSFESKAIMPMFLAFSAASATIAATQINAIGAIVSSQSSSSVSFETTTTSTVTGGANAFQLNGVGTLDVIGESVTLTNNTINPTPQVFLAGGGGTMTVAVENITYAGGDSLGLVFQVVGSILNVKATQVTSSAAILSADSTSNVMYAVSATQGRNLAGSGSAFTTNGTVAIQGESLTWVEQKSADLTLAMMTIASGTTTCNMTQLINNSGSTGATFNVMASAQLRFTGLLVRSLGSLVVNSASNAVVTYNSGQTLAATGSNSMITINSLGSAPDAISSYAGYFRAGPTGGLQPIIEILTPVASGIGSLRLDGTLVVDINANTSVLIPGTTVGPQQNLICQAAIATLAPMNFTNIVGNFAQSGAVR